MSAKNEKEVLERIFSLLPHKDGKIVHGEKKKFALSLGYSDGNIVSMWEKGTSTAFMGKLHEIAAKYNVSVEWLKGETDEKSPSPSILQKSDALIMDITLERILSLMEHDAKGKLKHGAKKTFAASIGYDCGNIVSMWISGESKSYLKKLHEIAAKYNVSVEWLKGETDEKNPSPSKAEGEGWKSELVEFISTCNDRAVLVEILKALTDRMSEMG